MAPNLINFQEKRFYPRFKANFLNFYQTLEKRKLSEPQLVILQNLSEGGAMFMAIEYFNPGKFLKMKVKLSNNAAPLETLAKVRHCEKSDFNPDLYHVGVCFLEPSRIFQESLHEIASRRLGSVAA